MASTGRPLILVCLILEKSYKPSKISNEKGLQRLIEHNYNMAWIIQYNYTTWFYIRDKRASCWYQKSTQLPKNSRLNLLSAAQQNYDESIRVLLFKKQKTSRDIMLSCSSCHNTAQH